MPNIYDCDAIDMIDFTDAAYEERVCVNDYETDWAECDDYGYDDGGCDDYDEADEDYDCGGDYED